MRLLFARGGFRVGFMTRFVTLFSPLASAAYFFGSDTHVGIPPLIDF
jgi:hypothetical protein